MKIKKKTLKNPIVQGVILFLVAAVFSILLGLLSNLLGIGYFTAVAPVIAGMLVGYFYTHNFKEIMSKNLRLQATGIFIGLQLVLVLFAGLALVMDMKVWISVTVMIYTILFVATYISLASGGKMYLKNLKK